MWVAQQRDDVDIVSVDSMQVYRSMDIGTAKPTAEEQRAVPHHLIDLVDVDVEFTVSTFAEILDDVLATMASVGRSALLVGGTGLYLRAAIDGLDLAGVWPEIRQRLEDEASALGARALYERLMMLDPEAAGRMEPDNSRRIVRALEVIEGSGRRFSSFGGGLDRYPEGAVPQVGLRWDRNVLAGRIGVRVQSMMEQGFLDEVERVLAVGPSRTARQALGYRELIDHLEGRCSLDEAVDLMIRRTRQFSVRQERWFRRDPRITWVDITEDPVAEAGPIVASLLP